MSKKSEKENVKAEDKVVAKAEDVKPEDVKPEAMTKKQYIEALSLIGIKPAAKALKEEVEKLYNDNLPKIELMGRIEELKEACLIKSFGDHGSSGICPKCKKKQEAVYVDCSIFKDIKGVVKTTSKRSRKMGHRTGDQLWGTKKKTMALRFCQYVLDADDKGITMAEATKAKWNPKGYQFNETLTRLLKEGLVEKKEDRYFVTALGLESSGKKKKVA